MQLFIEEANVMNVETCDDGRSSIRRLIISLNESKVELYTFRRIKIAFQADSVPKVIEVD